MAPYFIAFFLKVQQEPSAPVSPLMFIEQGRCPLLNLRLPGRWFIRLHPMVGVVGTAADGERIAEPINRKLRGQLRHKLVGLG